jgi:hypothetical protein
LLEGDSESEIGYHVKLLTQAGYIEANALSMAGHGIGAVGLPKGREAVILAGPQGIPMGDGIKEVKRGQRIRH